MKIAFDQSITATGIVAFTKKNGVVAKTIYGNQKLKDHDKRQDLSSRIIVYLEDLERDHGDPISHVCLEQFVSFVPPSKRGSMLRLYAFTGYLWARIEEWGQGKVSIFEIGKGNKSKEQVQIVAKGMGFTGDEHQCDAFYLGVLAGFDNVNCKRK